MDPTPSDHGHALIEAWEQLFLQGLGAFRGWVPSRGVGTFRDWVPSGGGCLQGMGAFRGWVPSGDGCLQDL